MVWTAQIRCQQPWPSSFSPYENLFGSILSHPEMAYIAKQRSRKRCFEFALGRALTKLLIHEIVGASPCDIKISLPNQRAPQMMVQNDRRWYLSIAHSRGAIQVVVSNQTEIGVDIQQVDMSRSIKPFITTYPALKDTPEDQFYVRWVCIEAYAKLQDLNLLDVLKHSFVPPPSVWFDTRVDSQYCSAIATPSREAIEHIDGVALLPSSLQKILSKDTS